MQVARRSATASILIALAAALGGCSEGPETATVKGKVTFQNQPVAEGTVQFMNMTVGGSFGAELNRDGTYVVPDKVMPGDYTVVVSPPVERVDTDPGKSPPAPVEKNMPNIPEKYRMQGSTTLKATVKPGPNDIDLDMQP